MADDTTVLERVQELTWALVDEQINEDEMRLLDSLLLSDAQARRCYLDCVQLHADLITFYNTPSTQPATAGAQKSPVLGFLNAGMPPAFDSPAEDAVS